MLTWDRVKVTIIMVKTDDNTMFHVLRFMLCARNISKLLTHMNSANIYKNSVKSGITTFILLMRKRRKSLIAALRSNRSKKQSCYLNPGSHSPVSLHEINTLPCFRPFDSKSSTRMYWTSEWTTGPMWSLDNGSAHKEKGLWEGSPEEWNGSDCSGLHLYPQSSTLN